MKRTALTAILTVSLCVFGVFGALAAPLIYLDFDQSVDPQLAVGDQYFLSSWSEVGTSVTAAFADGIGATDGFIDIKIPDGDGTTAPAIEGPQGGQALHTTAGAGNTEEGLNVEMSSLYATANVEDVTVEVTFWTSTNDIDVNTVGLQNIWSNSWPCHDGLAMELRIIGHGVSAARDRHLELAAWQGGGTEVLIVCPNELTPQTWHTAQVTFDYNESDPANSVLQLYLDDVDQGTVIYDATASGISPGGCTNVSVHRNSWGIWSTPPRGAREGIGSARFMLAISTSGLVAGTDNRGLDGAIDAFSVSEGVLTPAEFVLPGGYNPPPPTSAQDWNLYQ